MDDTIKRYSAEIRQTVYESVLGSIENSGDIFICVPQASRRVLWIEWRPEISEVEIIVKFHGGHEQIAIDALVSFFARVGSFHKEFVMSATVFIWKKPRDTKLQPIDGTDMISVAKAGERTERMSRMYSSFTACRFLAPPDFEVWYEVTK